MTAERAALVAIFYLPDFATVRPIFPTPRKVCAHGIVANILPFLLVRFVAPQQHMIEESLLPISR